jgi:hypothetical protein
MADDTLGYYSARDLINLGFVRSRADLSRKILNDGFPKPIKTAPYSMQAAAHYRRSEVIAWDAKFRGSQKP